MAALTIDAQKLRAERLVNLAERLTTEARADLPNGESLERLPDGQALGHLIGCGRSHLNSFTISTKRGGLSVCGVHLIHDLSSPSEASVTTPTVPSLPPRSIVVPRGALLIDLVASEVSKHAPHCIGAHVATCRQVTSASKTDRGHATLRGNSISTLA